MNTGGSSLSKKLTLKVVPDKHRFFGGLESFRIQSMSTCRKVGRPEMGTSQSICFSPNMMVHSIQITKQCQASFWILCLHWLLVKREGPGSQRSWFPLTKSAKKACPSFRPYLEALSISGDSQSIVVIEEAFSFKISSSIDSKKNYFKHVWIANTVVVGTIRLASNLLRRLRAFEQMPLAGG